MATAAVTAEFASLGLRPMIPVSAIAVGLPDLFILSAAWTLPVAIVTTLAARWLRFGMQATPPWIPVVPVFAFLFVTAGQLVHAWSITAFAQPRLASALVPAIDGLLFVGVLVMAIAAYRLLMGNLVKLPLLVRWIAFAIGTVAAFAIHIARFPALANDHRFPIAMQWIFVVVIGIITASTLARLTASANRKAVIGVAVTTFLIIISATFTRSLATQRVALVRFHIQTSGLMTRPLAHLSTRFRDRDGDGFAGLWGGPDCDDANAAIHPHAKELAANGIDDDCFAGDLSQETLAADRAMRNQIRQSSTNRQVKHVILITMDALRADALPFGGNPHNTAPALNTLAQRGTVFSRAYAQASNTHKSVPSLLSGRYPSNIHWLDRKPHYPLPVAHEDNLFVAEILKENGMKTAFVVPFIYAKRLRMNQGFDKQIIHRASRRKNDITADIIAGDAIRILQSWAAQPAQRSFLWLHFYETHHPYVKHKKFDFGNDARGRYLSELRWVDSQIKRVLTTLEQLGLADQTAIVVTSDHGEEFGEHGGRYHGDLYPEDLHVPLVVAVPGGTHAYMGTPVGLVDIAPTILALLGVPIPSRFDGVNLVPWLSGNPAPKQRYVYAELIPDQKVPRQLMTYIGNTWQLVVDFAAERRELYHLASDPFAQSNRIFRNPDQAKEIEIALREFRALRINAIRETTPQTPQNLLQR